MAEVIPASGDDWREIERRASLPEGHVERVLLEVLQRLVPVEDRVLPVDSTAAPGARSVITGVNTVAYPPGTPLLATPIPTAAPAGGVTEEELVEVMEEACALRTFDAARYLLSHPRIGPLLRGEGARRVVLAKDPPVPEYPTIDPFGGIRTLGYRDGWTAARAELARQQGEQP